tara:strand:+ start:1752 stop:1874 length:123 start_codon:yes stop_codon:yes gene_type:complete
MPKKVHRKLTSSAKKKGLKGERKKAYIYGTLSKLDKKRRR